MEGAATRSSGDEPIIIPAPTTADAGAQAQAQAQAQTLVPAPATVQPTPPVTTATTPPTTTPTNPESGHEAPLSEKPAVAEPTPTNATTNGQVPATKETSSSSSSDRASPKEKKKGGLFSSRKKKDASDDGDSSDDGGKPVDSTEQDPDAPFAHLPEHEAAILKKQTYTPTVKAGIKALYRYADTNDMIIITVCLIFAIVAGAALPLMTVLFGQLQGVFQDFFQGNMDYDEFIDEMSGFVVYFVYLAIGEFVSAWRRLE